MKEYTAIFQMEANFRARDHEQAEHRAEEIADKLQILSAPDHFSKRAWWPEIVEVTDTSLIEQ